MTQEALITPFGSPPVELIADNNMLWLFGGINLILAVTLTIWILRRQKSSDDKWLGVMVLIGGLLSGFMVPLFDHLTQVWHADPAATGFFTSFGHVITGWNFFAYYWFIGALGLYAYQRIKEGATTLDMWKLWGIVAICDILLEVPLQLVDRNIYTYFGHHPFYSYDYFPLPLFCVFANAACPLATAAAITLLKATKVRGHIFFVPLFVASSWFSLFYALPGWSWWVGLGANVNMAVMYAVGTVTLITILFTYQVVASATIRAVRAGLTDD